MWIANRNTKEKMSDGSYRNVPAGTPLTNPETLRLPRIKDWADFVEDDSEAAEKGREYLKSIEAEVKEPTDVVDAEFDEVDETKDAPVENTEVSTESDTETKDEVDETKDADESENVLDTTKYDSKSNSELKKLLKDAKIEYKNSFNSTQLKKLCAENNL